MYLDMKEPIFIKIAYNCIKSTTAYNPTKVIEEFIKRCIPKAKGIEIYDEILARVKLSISFISDLTAITLKLKKQKRPYSLGLCLATLIKFNILLSIEYKLKKNNSKIDHNDLLLIDFNVKQQNSFDPVFKLYLESKNPQLLLIICNNIKSDNISTLEKWICSNSLYLDYLRIIKCARINKMNLISEVSYLGHLYDYIINLIKIESNSFRSKKEEPIINLAQIYLQALRSIDKKNRNQIYCRNKILCKQLSIPIENSLFNKFWNDVKIDSDYFPEINGNKTKSYLAVQYSFLKKDTFKFTGYGFLFQEYYTSK